MSAHDILKAAAGHMQDRAATYDKPEGERSMGATVAAFNAVTGHQLTEEQGWLFMALLKAVRSQQGAYRADSYEDGAAYFALAGEAAARDRKRPVIRELYTEDIEARMDVVGQNGNTAEHYDQAPDWSQAPEGATHWGPETDGFYGAWYRKECDEWFCQPVPNGMGWVQDDYRSDLVPRPADEWVPSNGKEPDLPDGTVVEVKIKDGRTFAGVVGSWLWRLEREFDEITHYRIHQPE